MEFNKELFGFFKNCYHHEIERKDKINSYLSFPLAIITLIIGITSYFLNDLPGLKNDFLCISFYLLFFCLLICIIFSFYYFIRSFFRYPYDYISYSLDIHQYIEDLKVYNSNVEDVKKVYIENEFHDFLMEQYIVFSTNNAKNNEKKTYHMQRTFISIVFALIFLISTAIPFYVLKYNYPQNIQKVEIINLEESKAMSNSENKDKEKTQKTKEPQKPARPKGRRIMEGENKDPSQINLENEKE